VPSFLDAPVTKAQIVDRIAAATGLTKLETEAVVDGFMLTVVEAVEAGELVELRGFGTFRARLREARTARNPKTDAPVEVPRQFVPVFKPAAEFRRAVNEARQAVEHGRRPPAG
jgi:nucleoid DNA-binding protein